MKKSILFLAILLFSGLSVAQNDGYLPVETESDFEGVWVTVDNSQIRLFEDEFAPGGVWLILYESDSYFSDYIDPEMGASIDVGFDYVLNKNQFDCVMTSSNSLGYYMEHENQPFGFKLYFKLEKGERHLRLVNDFGTSYDLELYLGE